MIVEIIINPLKLPLIGTRDRISSQNTNGKKSNENR